MAELHRTILDAAAMHQFGIDLAGILHTGDLIVLTGPLGAGKTTLTRGLGEGLQVRGAVTSPTFVLARTHPSLVGGPPFVHVDAYRLNSAMELDDIEIERPQGRSSMASRTDAAASVLDLDHDLDEPRTVTLTGHGPRWARLALV